MPDDEESPKKKLRKNWIPRLTDKEKRFAELYVVYLNATRAYYEAFGDTNNNGTKKSKLTAWGYSSRLLDKKEVKEYIEELRRKACYRYDINLDRVLGEFARVGFANIDDFIASDGTVDLTKATREQKSAIQSIRTKTHYDNEGNPVREQFITLYNKNDSLTTIGKHLGLKSSPTEMKIEGNLSLEALILSTREVSNETKNESATDEL